MPKENTFWRGFGSVLCLNGGEHEELTFTYHGKDIAKITPQEAISQDWQFVSAALASAIISQRSENDSERE